MAAGGSGGVVAVVGTVVVGGVVVEVVGGGVVVGLVGGVVLDGVSGPAGDGGLGGRVTAKVQADVSKAAARTLGNQGVRAGWVMVGLIGTKKGGPNPR